VWGVKSVPGGFDSHMPPPKERFQIHCKSDGSFLYNRKLHFLLYKKPTAGCTLFVLALWENARKYIFVYKNSLRKTREIENEILKIIQGEK